MSGVAVLETIKVFDLAGWQLFIGFIPYIISCIIVLVRLFKAYKKNMEKNQNGLETDIPWHPKELLIAVVGAIITVILLICFKNYCPAKYVETQYEIKIENSASFNEVNNKYIILEEKENTYIVKERH
jgi:hypothetical protein